VLRKSFSQNETVFQVRVRVGDDFVRAAWIGGRRFRQDGCFPLGFQCFLVRVSWFSGNGEQFAPDCIIHQPVSRLSDISENCAKSARERTICLADVRIAGLVGMAAMLLVRPAHYSHR